VQSGIDEESDYAKALSIRPTFLGPDLRLIARYDTAIRRVIAPMAIAWNGNSGIPPPPPPVLELVVGALEVVVELVELLEVEEVLEVEDVEELVVLVVELVEEVVDVEVVMGELDHAKFANAKMVGPYAPQVAFTT
jgi:hypothetical protein